MRGMAAGPRLSAGFFIVMDRLYETLKQKIAFWKEFDSDNRGIFRIVKNKSEDRRLLLERMIVAHDVAAAFWYFHTNRYAHGVESNVLTTWAVSHSLCMPT